MWSEQFKHFRWPDAITLIGLGFSLMATFFLLHGRVFLLPAYFCILAQLICDFFDGRLARKIKRKDQFGVHLDNFADFYTILNSVLMGIVLRIHHFLEYPIFIFFVVAAAVRLAYFTVENAGKEKFFIGLPTTAVSFLLPTLLIMNAFFFRLPSNWLLFLYLIAAILMISPFRIRKFA